MARVGFRTGCERQERSGVLSGSRVTGLADLRVEEAFAFGGIGSVCGRQGGGIGRGGIGSADAASIHCERQADFATEFVFAIASRGESN